MRWKQRTCHSMTLQDSPNTVWIIGDKSFMAHKRPPLEAMAQFEVAVGRDVLIVHLPDTER